jgi:hypothetical protein
MPVAEQLTCRAGVSYAHLRVTHRGFLLAASKASHVTHRAGLGLGAAAGVLGAITCVETFFVLEVHVKRGGGKDGVVVDEVPSMEIT